jgi:hypothetical protein
MALVAVLAEARLSQDLLGAFGGVGVAAVESAGSWWEVRMRLPGEVLAPVPASAAAENS